MSKGEDISWWKMFLFFLGVTVAGVVVLSFVSSLPIYPSWLRLVLFFTYLVAGFFVFVSNKLWLQIPFFAALGILAIYTIRGVILGDIDLIIPSGGGGI